MKKNTLLILIIAITFLTFTSCGTSSSQVYLWDKYETLDMDGDNIIYNNVLYQPVSGSETYVCLADKRICGKIFSWLQLGTCYPVYKIEDDYLDYILLECEDTLYVPVGMCFPNYNCMHISEILVKKENSLNAFSSIYKFDKDVVLDDIINNEITLDKSKEYKYLEYDVCFAFSDYSSISLDVGDVVLCGDQFYISGNIYSNQFYRIEDEYQEAFRELTLP